VRCYGITNLGLDTLDKICFIHNSLLHTIYTYTKYSATIGGTWPTLTSLHMCVTVECYLSSSTSFLDPSASSSTHLTGHLPEPPPTAVAWLASVMHAAPPRLQAIARSLALIPHHSQPRFPSTRCPSPSLLHRAGLPSPLPAWPVPSLFP
jgi:hypothetical protein